MARRDFGMLEQRPPRPGFYLRFTWRGRRYRRYAGTTRTLAAATLARIQVELERGATVDEAFAEVFGEFSGARLTVRDAVAPYLAYATSRRKASTVRSLRQTLAIICRAPWSASLLRDVKPADIQAWTSERVNGGTSGATVNRNLNALSGLYRWAMRCGHVEDNPVRRVERFSERGRARETYLTAEESRALVAACRPGIREVVLAALHTGMRRGELLALRWRCVDLARRELVIEAETEKAGRGRIVPMTAEIHAVLTALRGVRPVSIDGRDAVFVLPDGREITPKMVRSRFEGAVARCAGIPLDKKPKVTFHCLRHTAASLLVAAGVPIYDVAKLLGHTTIAVTMRYAHFAPASGRAAIERLGSALAPTSDSKPEARGHADGVAETPECFDGRRSA